MTKMHNWAFRRRKIFISWYTILLFSTLVLPSATLAQSGVQNSGSAILLGVSYGGHLSGGDLKERFGTNLSPAIQLDYQTDPKNWIFSVQASFQFGSEVKTDVLVNLRTAEGFVIANDRAVADIQLRERGFYLGGSIGKLISLSAKNYRSGLRIDLGAGLLQHQIRIQDDPVRTVAALTGDYRKGYDRLSNGPALREFIGYQYQSLDRRANFFAGVELIQGFTQSRRDFDFLLQQKDDSKRVDLLTGFRIGLILPFYVGQNPDEIFY
ncbi:MAG: hypothetical protein R2824_23020 [Saprospiraceae bacterium]|nr:hypothetical protein [Lewinella sp.]